MEKQHITAGDLFMIRPIVAIFIILIGKIRTYHWVGFVGDLSSQYLEK